MRCRSGLAMLLLVGAAHCARPTPSPVEYWTEQAASDANRISALKELGQLGPAATATLVHYLHEAGPWQTTAAAQLGLGGDANAAAALVAHLDYQTNGEPELSSRVRLNQEIVRSLGALHARGAIEPLLKLLSCHDPQTRELAVEALGTVHAQQATAPLLTVIADPNAMPTLAQAAVRALGEIGAQQAIAPLIAALYNESLYEDARVALVQIGRPAVGPLVGTVERKNAAVEDYRAPDGGALPAGVIEAHAASVLGYMRAAEAAPSVAAAFERLLDVYASHPRAAPATLLNALGDMAETLGRLGGAASRKQLLALLRAPDASLRVAAADGLVLWGPDVAASRALLAAVGHGSEARVSLLEGLSRLGGTDVLHGLEGLPEVGRRGAVYEDVRDRAAVVRECQNDVPCWRRALGSSGVARRERAIYEVGWRGDVAAVPDLINILDSDSSEASMAAAVSLHRLVAPGTAPSAAPARVVLDTATIERLHSAAVGWRKRDLLADSLRELRALVARCRSADPA